jgi:hypothetical protein
MLNIEIFGCFRNNSNSFELNTIDFMQSINAQIAHYNNQISGSLFEGNDYINSFSFDAGNDPYSTLKVLFHKKEISAFNCMILSEEKKRYYDVRPLEHSIAITILSGYNTLEDGFLDFNWQYNYWSSQLNKVMDISGIDLSAFW